MSTGTANIVTCTGTDTGPVTMGIGGGIEAGVLTGEGKKAVGTGQIMTEEGLHLATEVMNEAGKSMICEFKGGSNCCLEWENVLVWE